MSNDRVKDQELEQLAERIRQSIRHILTAPRDVAATWRQASFGALSHSGSVRANLTEQAVQLSACHVIGEREPRVTDVVVNPKLQRGKLVSVAVSYTIKSSKKRDKLAIAY